MGEDGEESVRNRSVEWVCGEGVGMVESYFMRIREIGKKVVLGDKELVIDLWKLVDILMGGGKKVDIRYEEIGIEMFWKRVYEGLYGIGVLG